MTEECAARARERAQPFSSSSARTSELHLARQEDPAVAKLRKELKEIGFDEQVIQAVLLLESGGAIPSLEQAIDLCLGHAEFQVSSCEALS